MKLKIEEFKTEWWGCLIISSIYLAAGHIILGGFWLILGIVYVSINLIYE